jgi:putative permease
VQGGGGIKLWLRVAALVVGTLLLAGWLVHLLYIMLAPFLLSLLLSYLLHPAVNRLERAGIRRSLAIFSLFGGLLLIFALFVVALLPGMIRELQLLYTDFPAFLWSLEREILSWQATLAPTYPFLARVDMVARLAAFRQGLREHLLQVLPYLSRTMTPHILFVPLLTFFLLRDGPTFRKALFRLIPNRYFELVFLLQYRLNQQVRNYIRGILLDSFAVGAITALGLHLMNIRYALFLGVAYGLANLIPFFGPVLGTLPGLILAVSQGGKTILPVILVYILAQIVSVTVIVPAVMARMVQLHPLVVIMAVIAGANLFGPLGPLLSVPLTALLKVILWESYQGLKSLKH